MPTGRNNAVLPVTTRTKARLEAVKGRFTYDQLLQEFLRLVPPERVRARLDLRQAEDVARATMPVASAQATGPPRTPDKQLLIAALAEERWRLWLREGRVARLGPRRYAYRPQPPEETARDDVRARPGRGLPAR